MEKEKTLEGAIRFFKRKNKLYPNLYYGMAVDALERSNREPDPILSNALSRLMKKWRGEKV